MKKFETILGINNPLLQSIKERGFEHPTEIQEKSIPLILEGKDVIAGASTGSGKTLAFSSALIKNCKKDFGVQGLVLTPTRELAEQVAQEISKFSVNKHLKVTAVYGGVSMFKQVRAIKESEIVIGTPGRILDHLSQHTLNLTKINTLVLDEADRMFDMGFRHDVEKIISFTNKTKQTLLFSATISPDIVKLSQRHMVNPVEVSAQSQVDPTKLKQIYYDVEDNVKYSLLMHLLQNEDSHLVMIFCNTRKNVDFVTKNLQYSGLEVVPIHGGYTQEKRNRFLEQFHSNRVHILVATDVAARGLDIKGVTHVYNFNIPPTIDEYIHRIGRTARAGKEGKVINIIASRDYDNFQSIINSKEFKIEKIETPEIELSRIRWIPERGQNRSQNRPSRTPTRNSTSRRSHERKRNDFRKRRY